MSRQKFEKTFNTFTKGLMTEASELNFPEDFSLYEKNFLLHRDGGRDRRKGMELLYPLGLVLTSKPYVIEADSEVVQSFGASLVSGRLWEDWIVDVEETVVSLGASLVSGSLRDLLYEMIAEPETVQSLGASLVSGYLQDTLWQITIDPETVQSNGATLASGWLSKTLVEETIDPETVVSHGASLIEGYLNE